MFGQCCYAILILQCSHTITRKALPLGWCRNTRVNFSAIRLPTAADGHHIAILHIVRRDWKKIHVTTNTIVCALAHQHRNASNIFPRLSSDKSQLSNMNTKSDSIYYMILITPFQADEKREYIRNVLHFSQIQNRKFRNLSSHAVVNVFISLNYDL